MLSYKITHLTQQFFFFYFVQLNFYDTYCIIVWITNKNYNFINQIINSQTNQFRFHLKIFYFPFIFLIPKSKKFTQNFEVKFNNLISNKKSGIFEISWGFQ